MPWLSSKAAIVALAIGSCLDTASAFSSVSGLASRGSGPMGNKHSSIRGRTSASRASMPLLGTRMMAEPPMRIGHGWDIHRLAPVSGSALETLRLDPMHCNFFCLHLPTHLQSRCAVISQDSQSCR
jgi:hypothetical protein